jgi:pimeloyl-ACP methyl ester carboxylesterase
MDEEGLFLTLESAAERYGRCDPLWFREKRSPVIDSIAGGKEGPEMLLLHGLFGALSNWESVFPLFEKFSRPTAIKFPLLSLHRSEVKIKSLALLTEYFIRKEHSKPVVLCGNSLGGHVALRLCLASPELVDCLVLAGTSGLYEHTVDSLPVRPKHDFVRDHMYRVFWDTKFITDEAVNEIASTLAQREHVLNLIHAARSAKRDNLQNLLSKIAVPTLLLWGEDDQVTTLDVAHQFNQLIPNSTLVTIKNCGHAPMIEHPEWFADEVDKFLRKHSRVASSNPI